LRIVGQVVHISPGGKAVVKAEMTPRIGEPAFDEKNRRVGKVFDVIGPTVSPYVEVSLSVEDPKSVVGGSLYVPSSQKKKRWSKKR
jgi:rRNA processing protein Gar1